MKVVAVALPNDENVEVFVVNPSPGDSVKDTLPSNLADAEILGEIDLPQRVHGAWRRFAPEGTAFPVQVG